MFTHARLWFALIVLCSLPCRTLLAGPWLKDWAHMPYTPAEQRDIEKTRNSLAAQTNRNILADFRKRRAFGVYSDRAVYLAGDGVGQAVIDAWSFGAWDDAAAMRVKLGRAGGQQMDELIVPLTGASATCKVVLRLPTDKLPPGRYELQAEMLGADRKPLGEPASHTFERSAKSAPGGAIPAEGVPLVVGRGAGGVGGWPISTGVPMPRGAVADVSRLTLLENGKPVPAQWTVRSRWSPAPDADVRWVGLSFIAKYDNGKPRDYRITLAPQPAAKTADVNLATEHADRIEVNTGPLRFTVRKTNFAGITAAWLDGGQVVHESETAGPYIVDHAGRRHFASLDPDVKVTIEEQGPARVVIAAQGWYVAKESDAPRLCRFVTHLTAHAGQSHVDVSHRTIIAYDTRTRKLADIGFAVPMRDAQRWATGIDGQTHQGAMPAAGTTWLHQYRADRVRLGEAIEGARADGWIAASGTSAAVLCTLRDIWQKFPKELEAGRDGITLHFWPRHGIDTFTDEEQTDLRQIIKARFAHHGKLLDLQMPQRYYDVLKAHHDATRWDPENTAPIGFASTGEGVSISNDFALWFMPASAADGATCTGVARIFQNPPHAIADPRWNVAAGIDAPMAARDDERWPMAEQLLNRDFPIAMFNILEHVGGYGMWIYANTFNTWRDDYPGLHRIWQNSHYGHVGESWKLYFRGASPDVLRWARAQSDHFMNIGTVHHVIPDVSAPGRQPGAMYHAKGFLPWGARQRGQFTNDGDVRNWGHFIDPDAFLWRYLLEGDLFARDVYHMWVRSIDNGTFPMHGPGRESINDVAMLLNAYAMTWDPQAVIHLYRRGVNVTLATPLEDAKTSVGSFPVWHKRWADRYHMLTRDDRVVQSIAGYVRAGYRHWAPSAFAWRQLRDVSLLEPIFPGVYGLVRQVYRHPGDPLDGFGEHVAARSQEELMQLPEVMQALNEAGFDESSLPPPAGYYPTGDVLALNPDGRDFSLKIEMPMMSGGYDHHIRVIAPSGKVVRTVLIGRLDVLKVKPDETSITMDRARFIGKNIQQVPVPAGGEKGLFTIRLSGHACQLAVPATNLPHEAVSLTRDRAYRPGTRFVGVVAAPAEGRVEWTVTGLGYGTRTPFIPVVTWTRLEGPDGTPLMEDTLCHIASRTKASVSLPPADARRIHRFQVLGEMSVIWAGDASHVLLAPRAEDAAAVMDAMK